MRIPTEAMWEMPFQSAFNHHLLIWDENQSPLGSYHP